MAKEWILNQANMRWQFNRPRNVGKVSEEIRKCAPKSLRDWEGYYYRKIYPREHLEQLGRKLYIKISEVCHAEIESTSEQDCIDFVINLVIKRLEKT